VRMALAAPGIGRLATQAGPGGLVTRALELVRSPRPQVSAVTVEEGLPGQPGAQGETSFETLFRAHEEDVRRLCRRLLGDEAARDASQEVFLRARRGFESCEPARPFRRWLLAVTGNHCIDQLRRRSRETRIFDPRDFDPADLLDPGASPLGLTLRAEERERLLGALDALPLKYRLPLVLRYFQELDYDGIGDVLGVSRGQVGTLLFRAKRRLREALADDTAPTGGLR
jgi:RNA polymerase sigma factor (sigma-70 family)